MTAGLIGAQYAWSVPQLPLSVGFRVHDHVAVPSGHHHAVAGSDPHPFAYHDPSDLNDGPSNVASCDVSLLAETDFPGGLTDEPLPAPLCHLPTHPYFHL